MKAFNLKDRFLVVCEADNTRNGFKHTAWLLHNGNEIKKTKINYLNRTWERFQFESVINKVITEADYLTINEKTDLLNNFKN